MLIKVYTGEITDDDMPLMPTFFYDLPSTFPCQNPYISVNSPSGHGRALDGSGLHIFNLPKVFAKAGFQSTDGSFVVPSVYSTLYFHCPTFIESRSK